MDDQEFRELIAPLVRSRQWLLIISGGMSLIGAGQFLGLLWIAAWIPDWGVPLFWKFLGLPVGILALLAGWQMFRLYRLLSMSLRSIQLSIVSEVADRTRLVLIYTGVMMLLFIFIIGGEIFWSPSMFG